MCAIYSTFLQRAYDQIVHDVCLQSLPVVFCMDRAGLVGDDGPTHHGVFDIAYLRCLPNMALMAPRDEAMLVHMLHTALRHDAGPVAIRYPRGEGVGVPLPAHPERIPIGTGEILREGERVAILGYGTGVGKALGAADLLAEGGLDVTVADARFAKPLDAGLLAQLAAEHDLLVTVEEGVLSGGFGSGVWEPLSEGGLAPRVLRVGLPDRYVTHGAPKLLHEEVGFTAERDRRAHRGRGLDSARLARLRVIPASSTHRPARRPLVRYVRGRLEVRGLPARSAVAEITLYRVTKRDGATKPKRYRLRAQVLRPGARTLKLSVRPRAPR